jgi:hypothetical protein
VGCCECGDEPSGSDATELVTGILNLYHNIRPLHNMSIQLQNFEFNFVDEEFPLILL